MGLKLRNFTALPLTIRTPERDINLAVDPEVLSRGAPSLGLQRRELGGFSADLGEETESEVPFALSFVTIVGLPEPIDDTVLIVDEELANHPNSIGRHDLVYVGEAIHDGSGRVEAFQGLCPGVGLGSWLVRVAEKRNARAAAADMLQQLRRYASVPDPEATQDEAKERGPEPTSESIKEPEPEPTAA